MRTRTTDMDARCAEYVALMERGHTILEVADMFGLQRNAVHEALLARKLPTSMKAAVRAYWQRQDAINAARLAEAGRPETPESLRTLFEGTGAVRWTAVVGQRPAACESAEPQLQGAR